VARIHEIKCHKTKVGKNENSHSKQDDSKAINQYIYRHEDASYQVNNFLAGIFNSLILPLHICPKVKDFASDEESNIFEVRLYGAAVSQISYFQILSILNRKFFHRKARGMG
jgi:hypothetical protein